MSCRTSSWKLPERIPDHATTDLAEALEQPAVEAAILCTPTQQLAAEAIQCMEAGKHVELEIPLADTLADAQAVHEKIKSGELNIQQMDVQNYFFRRKNINALGEPRSWTVHLLWHHAAHTVDLFQYQAGGQVLKANAIQGPIPELGIAMDMSIQMKTDNDAICALSLSFKNDGPLGTFFRYICDNGTWIARYDDLVNGREEPVDVSKVDVSMNGIELQDREFFAAIAAGREPNSSVGQVLPCYQVVHDLEMQLNSGAG